MMDHSEKEEFKRLLQGHYTATEIRIFLSYLDESNVSLADAANRLLQNEPIQYICQTAWFYNRPFIVNSSTLIPRPETEELCEIILADFPNKNNQIIDIGTGCGCIPITLKLENPQFQITATDISKEALEIAQQNADKHQLHGIQFIQNDFIQDPFPGNEYELIVSNPPYIAWEELNHLEPMVSKYEPHTALFPIGNDPLIFYKRLQQFLTVQQKQCTLFAEINSNLSSETMEIFDSFKEKELLHDFSGNPRFIKIKKEG